MGRPARRRRRRRRRPARARRRPRRPRRRLPAEHPRDDRGVPGLREPRRDLVVVLAGLRRAQRDRPLRADRAEGALRGRRLPLRRPRLRPPRRGRPPPASRCPRSSTPWCCPTWTRTPDLSGLDAAIDLGRAGPGRRAARVRAGAVRPSAVGALLVGHDRPAEGDRARPRRDPARAPQGAEPARRRAARRPRLLVHHDRLDDVELPRRRRCTPRPRSSSTTAAPGTRTSACCGTSPSAPA